MRAHGWWCCLCCWVLVLVAGCGRETETVTVERTEYHAPENHSLLVDDRLEDHPPLAFNSALISPAKVDPDRAWQLNTSSVVFRLDVPPIDADDDRDLLTLHRTYMRAHNSADSGRFLVSANMIDGKAKQIDDGLYAALELLQFQGSPPRIESCVQVVRRVYNRLPPQSEAAAFLAAALEQAGELPPNASPDAAGFRQAFLQDERRSKPIGFYTWNEPLQRTWKFMRFLQTTFGEDRAIPVAIRNALHADPALLSEYDRINSFFAKLTNPFVALPLGELPGQPIDDAAFAKLCQDRGVRLFETAFLPPSNSREGELFSLLFPAGAPPNANLMSELTARVQAGQVDLKPRSNSGWYDHQCFALEPLLVLEQAAEHRKLLLLRSYKERMQSAFQTLITKRRETHARQLHLEEKKEEEGPPPPPPQESIRPQFRVEPCPTFYLRTARAYRFVAAHLAASLGDEILQSTHGLTEDGKRERPLSADLLGMQRLCIGLYLIACEDLGMPPELNAEEAADSVESQQAALRWLANLRADSDLECDTRVAVPIYANDADTRVWATLGVRLVRLTVSFVHPPSMRPAKGDHPWEVATDLGAQAYLLPVEEFAEFSLPGARVLTREEFRAICNREQTREKILAAITQPQ